MNELIIKILASVSMLTGSAGLGAAFVLLLKRFLDKQDNAPKKNLQEDVDEAIEALSASSRLAHERLFKLRRELADRARGIQEAEKKLDELRVRRTFLELTPEQRTCLRVSCEPREID